MHKTPRGPEEGRGLLDLLSTHWDHQTESSEGALFAQELGDTVRPSCCQGTGHSWVINPSAANKWGMHTAQEFFTF